MFFPSGYKAIQTSAPLDVDPHGPTSNLQDLLYCEALTLPYLSLDENHWLWPTLQVEEGSDPSLRGEKGHI